MHANRNKKAVKRVEKGMMKANRIRNLFAVFAIVLTTFMITTVFSLGINYMENMKLMQVRTAGTTANASLAMPTEKQEQQIKNLEYVKTVGTQYMVGSVAEKNDEGRDLSIALSYYDPTEWEKHYKETIKDIEGKYPSDENEIMLSEDALSQLGMKEPKLNMEIPLSYYDKNGQQEKNFTLSGWFHSYTGTGMGFVSEAYCKNAGYTMAEDGVLSLSLNKMPDDFYRIQKDVELNENQSFGGAVSMKSSSGSVIAMVILLVFFIIGSGYLLIYNVLYISISKDTRFYGLMKTLGTTQKQIKSLVKNQAVKFACIGIPIGIVLATAVSFGIVPFVLNEGFEQGKSMMDAEVFFHPSIYILSILFSAVTVWIACNAPAKAAAKISPIEALKFQNFAPKKTKSRNSTNGGKLHVMAFHNVFRDKKRAILVFMSLFMGITMILGVNGVISSMSAENFIKEYMDYNFEYNDIQFEQPEQLNKEYWKESAKMLAGMIHLMRGTPYIYQGEEIGMTNPHYTSIEQYADVESRNYYEILLNEGKTKEEALEILAARSRDNSRTPMQWTDERYCGFSDTKPWIPVSDNFEKINVKKQKQDRDSILEFYKKLIMLRKEKEVIARGNIEFMEVENAGVLAYTRCLDKQKLLVCCNFRDVESQMEFTQEWKSGRKILGNYEENHKNNYKVLTLRPYEIIVLEKGEE